MKERWKRAFEIDPESPFSEDRVNLTEHQKDYIRRAWTHYFGFIPNAIPIYNEEEGFAHRPAIEPQLHHILPVHESIDIYGEGADIYNNPRNIVPISIINHTGKGLDYSDDQFVIHKDMVNMNILYSEFKKGLIENPFLTMARERKKYTSVGLPYHETDYDMYLLQLADIVVSKYEMDFPDDIY